MSLIQEDLVFIPKLSIHLLCSLGDGNHLL